MSTLTVVCLCLTKVKQTSAWAMFQYRMPGEENSLHWSLAVARSDTSFMVVILGESWLANLDQ